MRKSPYTWRLNLPKPVESYYYPGFTIGGPLLIPRTSFNHSRNKLFFSAGDEYMKRQLPGTPHELFVPTVQTLAGNFSPEYLATLGQAGLSGVVLQREVLIQVSDHEVVGDHAKRAEWLYI
jgi:hypothetical protein